MIKMNLKSGLILVIICIIMSCKNSSNYEESNVGILENQQDSTLYAVLEMEERYGLTEGLKLNFTVFNPTSDTLSFSKYHTPYEGFMSNFLTILDGEGNEIVYNGPMAKRIMPPVKESYVFIAPKSAVTTTIDISKAYQLSKEGTYNITYNGGNISGMENGKPIQIILEK